MIRKYFDFRPFSFEEAWLLFRIAAFGEAFGWSLLIGGLLSQRYFFKTSDIPVLITGQLHGTLFLIYIAAVIVLSPSLAWKPKRILLAGACSVPPYGSLLFELWSAHQLKRLRMREFYLAGFYRQLLTN